MAQILQGSARNVPFFMVQSADHITGATGAAPTVTISKDGGAFAAPSGTVSELTGGWYNLALAAADTGTLGALAFHATGTGADPVDWKEEIVAYDGQDAAALGLSRLDAAVSSRSTLTQADILSDATPFPGADIDAAVSSRSSHAAADVIAVTLSELAQGQPPATPTVGEALALLYMALRNASTMDTSGIYTIADDAGTVICKATVTDDGTTVTVPKLVTGP